MLVEEQKLRWCGIDMRARWRRKVAVVATYSSAVVLLGLASEERWPPHPFKILFAMIAVTFCWEWLSVFRENGVVKRFGERPSVHIHSGERVRVNGLDDWARYRYGVANFEAATEEQQNDLLARYRFGTFYVSRKNYPTPEMELDEREKSERSSAERWALHWIAFLVACWIGTYLNLVMRHKTVDPREVVCLLWTLVILLRTLPKARVLWTEPDPREVAGEIELVRREA